MSRPAFPLRARRGFTLIELLITVTILALVGAAVVSVFTSQQRFVRAAADLGQVRTQVQTAALVLPSDLRNISPVGRDILAMSDSAIRIRSTVATSVVCARSGNVVTLAPAGTLPSSRPGGGSTTIRLTSVLFQPKAGDAAFIWDQGSTSAASDDAWTWDATSPYAVQSVAVPNGACAAPFAPAANTLPAIQLTLSNATPLRPTLVVGAGVRVTREAWYALYQSAADSRWYLGYRDPDLGTYEYVAGPFLDYAASNASGLRFRYFDVNGAEITNYALRTSVARIEISARARSGAASSLGGYGPGKRQEDSLRVGVSLRNRS